MSVSTVKRNSVFTLNPRPDEAQYSPAQKELFSLLPKNGKRINSIELAELRQKKFGWDIEFSRNSIIATMTSLIDKIEKNDEPFRIVTKRFGPYPSEFWIEPK